MFDQDSQSRPWYQRTVPSLAAICALAAPMLWWAHRHHREEEMLERLTVTRTPDITDNTPNLSTPEYSITSVNGAYVPKDPNHERMLTTFRCVIDGSIEMVQNPSSRGTPRQLIVLADLLRDTERLLDHVPGLSSAQRETLKAKVHTERSTIESILKIPGPWRLPSYESPNAIAEIDDLLRYAEAMSPSETSAFGRRLLINVAPDLAAISRNLSREEFLGEIPTNQQLVTLTYSISSGTNHE